MCIWFPTSQLPFAFGILLFLVKIVRTTNDNVASMFYETATAYYTPENEKSVSSRGLAAYFWIGFAICIFSTVCSFLLAQIHESVIDNSSNSEVKKKKQELKVQAKAEEKSKEEAE